MECCLEASNLYERNKTHEELYKISEKLSFHGQKVIVVNIFN